VANIRMILAELAIGFAIAAAPLSASAQQEIVIGAILPLTGPAAPIGIEEQQGVQFMVDRVNAKGGVRGRKIKVLFEDSQGKPDQGVLSFNRLVDLNNIPVTLTAYSSISLAIAPLATRRKVLVVNPAAQTNKLETASPYLINTIPLVNNEISHIAAFAFKNVGKTAAIIYENAAAGIDSRDDFKKYFEAAGGKILADEAVEFGQTNYRSTLLKVASVKPELVFIGVTQSHAAFAEQVGQVPGFPVAIGSTFSRPFFGFPATKGWYHTAILSGTTSSDEQEFNAKFGTKEMGFFAREYSNSTDIIVQAIDRVLGEGKPLSGDSIKQAIFAIKTFKSGVAEITFTSNTAVRPVEIYRHGDSARELIKFDAKM
jgi:branched-chain amino acid transport system substrate-binding protein